MTPMIATALSASLTMVIAPCANISLRLSMSLVMRVIKRPTGMRSKNAARWASTWSKIETRRSCIVRWPASCKNHCSKNAELPGRVERQRVDVAAEDVVLEHVHHEHRLRELERDAEQHEHDPTAEQRG